MAKPHAHQPFSSQSPFTGTCTKQHCLSATGFGALCFRIVPVGDRILCIGNIAHVDVQIEAPQRVAPAGIHPPQRAWRIRIAFDLPASEEIVGHLCHRPIFKSDEREEENLIGDACSVLDLDSQWSAVLTIIHDVSAFAEAERTIVMRCFPLDVRSIEHWESTVLGDVVRSADYGTFVLGK